jgi:hypothetical protein
VGNRWAARGNIAECPRRPLRRPGNSWFNRTVLGVVAEFTGLVEYLPPRWGEQAWQWPRVSEVVVFRPGRLLPLRRGE